MASCAGEAVAAVQKTRKANTLDPKRHVFQTKLAFALTVVTLVLFGVLSIAFGRNSLTNDFTTTTANDSVLQSQHERWLQNNLYVQGESGDDGGGNQNGDYSSYSCHYIFDVTPDAGADQCSFARTCNQGAGVWASFVFCSNHFSAKFLCLLMSPFVLLWLVLLFRMLGSTAEDFFSPALEMFSVKLGLPPRFAGVSLLALGNGAADVSATVSAITNDPQNGYKLSLGALTGAAMVISCVVSACVILAAEGVPCRGALVRDAMALLVTVLVVGVEVGSGSIGPEAVTIFLTLYIVFVLLVLVADVYHRAVVLPRLASMAQERERDRQLEEERLQEAAMHPDADMDFDGLVGHGTSPRHHHVSRASRITKVLTALSNYDTEPVHAAGPDGWGVESDDLAQDRPIVLHGAHGVLHGDGIIHTPSEEQNATYSMLEDAVDRTCTEAGSPGISASNWRGAFHDGKQELMQHVESTWDDIVWNGDVPFWSKFLLICELPFTALRKITVPIPCEGYYVRALIALSMAVSPVWFGYYMYRGHDVNVLGSNGRIIFLLYWLVLCVGALFVLRYAPGGEGHMALTWSTPIALYGFFIAATWIDTIADSLVSLLDFLGIILRIPGPIVGLTILAWGNSMGDLSADVTMARKGLANMAITACFAGPVFNILMGLGLGFSSLEAQTGKLEATVSLSPSVLTGIIFVAINCVALLLVGLFLCQGKIPKKYGYVALTIYTIYVGTAITVQFTNGDN